MNRTRAGFLLALAGSALALGVWRLCRGDLAFGLLDFGLCGWWAWIWWAWIARRRKG